MQNKTIKALIIGISLLPSLAFAGEGRFFNFHISADSPFYFLDKFDEFLDRMLTFKAEKKVQLEAKLSKEREEETMEIENKNKVETRLSDDEEENENDEDGISKMDDDSDDDEDEEEDEDDDRGGSRGTTVSIPPTTSTQPAPTTGTGITVKSYTMAEVSTHNSAGNCWSVVNGGVYNLTSWIGKHPGGASAIKGICGVDGSADFNGQHSGAARPASELAGFKIGVLK